MWQLLRRNPRFARLWTGESVSMLGDHVTGLALPMVALLLLRADAWQLGLLTAAAWAPYLLAVVIGTLVDRVQHKRVVLIMVDLIRAGALATIPIAYLAGRLGFVQLLVVALLVGTAGVVSQTAYTAFFVRVVAPEDVVTANGLGATSRSAAGLVGPPAAGWLIHALGAALALVVDSVSYLVSALSLAGLRVREPVPPPARRGIGGSALDGLRTLLADRWLAPTLWCTSLMNLGSFAVVAVVLVYLTDSLGLGPGAIGTAQGLGAVGALLGAAAAARLARRFGLFSCVLVGVLAFSLPYLALAALPGTWSPAALVVGYGAVLIMVSGGIMVYDVLINSMMITVMRDDMRGRIIGAFSSINYGIRPLGALLGGLAAQAWGPRVTIAVAALVALTALVPLWRSPLRGCRDLADVPAPEQEPVAAG